MSDEDNVIHVQFGAGEAAPEPVEREPAPPENHEKLDAFTEMVDAGTVMVTLDARKESVVVPDQLRDQLRLNLNFCHLFGIPDFDYDEWGVRASLSFSGVDFFCDVPWESVYMMRSHVRNEALLFPDAIPQEVLAFVAPPELQPSGEEE